MKKVLSFILLASTVVACHDCPDCSINPDCSNCPTCNPDLVIKGDLYQTWVYDHPEEKITERITFTETGVFYYSNKETGVYDIDNENVMGRYTRSENNILGSYVLMGQPLVMDFTILELDSCKLTLKENKSGLTFTYNKLVCECEVDFMKSMTPDYQKYVSDSILSFESHDTNIVTVDKATGVITGVGVGIAYVDVVTDKGTVVVLVEVKTNYVDYSNYLGMTENDIRAEFGDDIYRSDATKIAYMSEDGVQVIFGFDSLPRVVSTIGIDYSASKIYDEAAMSAFIGSKYTHSNDLSNESIDVYMDVDGTSLTELSFIVSIVKGKSQVVYNAYNFAPFKDHSVTLGKSRDEIYELYNGKDYEYLILDEAEYLAYYLLEKNAEQLWLYFTDSIVTATEVVLYSTVDLDEIHGYLATEYNYQKDYSTEDEYAYISKDEKIVVFLTKSDRTVFYMLPTQTTKSVDIKEAYKMLKANKTLNLHR